MWDTGGMSYLQGPTGDTAPQATLNGQAGNGFEAAQPNFWQGLIQLIGNRQSGVARSPGMNQSNLLQGGSENTNAANSARGGLSSIAGALGGGAGAGAGLGALGGF